MSIRVSNLTYLLPNQDSLFSDISFSIPGGCKCAAVGNNGTGKSTLLNILSGLCHRSSGEIECTDAYLVPQHYGQYDGLTVAQSLLVEEKYRALKAILLGDASERNFDILQDDWELEERISAAFRNWGISHICLDSQMSRLSGGEKTKVFLSGIDIHHPAVVLMDEPTNHLDYESREQLLQYISESSATVLVASHDRMLLNSINFILHLTRQGIRYYPMKYDEFHQLYQQERDAIIRSLDAKQRDWRKAKRQARECVERQQKRLARGSKLSDSKCLARISKGNLKNKSEVTASNIAKVQADRIDAINREIDELQNLVPEESRIKINVSSSNLHKGKVFVELKAVNFNYADSNPLWRECVNLTIRSGDRIHIIGKNGQGKTTLLKLITGELNPTSGTIFRADAVSYTYLDQEYKFINNDMTVLEQLASGAVNMPEHELKNRLHQFLFPKHTWDRKCSALSGG
ncbi:MAG: ATP-binding cassette domain-containing protein [Bacteroides sp.]|nr:ATP-binding cassette domain-containing protein [Roseburia sp.]MCM1347244.1 ATP-binding cassette domain-containing protein [Bacteroides sp.]MCM1421745.1 ATP-binding cassette domain-containing protein [Bacteroides sp.]